MNFKQFMEGYWDEYCRLSEQYKIECPEPPTFIEWVKKKAKEEAKKTLSDKMMEEEKTLLEIIFKEKTVTIFQTILYIVLSIIITAIIAVNIKEIILFIFT